MMKTALRIISGAFLCVILGLGGVAPASAQNAIQAMVIATCGTPNITLTAGKVGPVFQDTTGTLCSKGSGSSPATVQGNVSNASSGVAATSTNVPTVSYNYLWDGTLWDQATGLLTGTVGAPGADIVTIQSPITPGSAGFPAASTPLLGIATGTTGAVVGTLAANSTKTTYICGFNVSAIGGTAAVGPITIAGLITGSMVYQIASAVAGNLLSVPFTPCIPASAINTAITVTTTADGTASAVDVNSWGFQQ